MKFVKVKYLGSVNCKRDVKFLPEKLLVFPLYINLLDWFVFKSTVLRVYHTDQTVELNIVFTHVEHAAFPSVVCNNRKCIRIMLAKKTDIVILRENIQFRFEKLG